MKYALISGASRGLGKEIAKTFAKHNYNLLLNYLKNDEAALQVKEEIERDFGVLVHLLKGDISNPLAVEKMHHYVKEKKLNLEVLVCNAGIDHVCEISEKNYDDFLQVLKVNILGNFLLLQSFGQDLERQKKGSIIIINSDNVIDANDSVTLEYDVSKAGLLMMAKDYALAFKYAKIHSICPGWLDTDMNIIPEDVKKDILFTDKQAVCESVWEQTKNEESGNVVVVR